MKWLKNMFAQNYDEDIDFSDTHENIMFEEVKPVIKETVYTPPVSIRAAQTVKEKKEVSLTELVTVTMSGYEATGDVAKYIRDKKPQIVNMERLSDPEIQRAIDYLSGVSYAVNGTLEMFASKIYVMLPESITLKRD
ncbi:cell division protein SepF [Candidatus Epulonipiscium viviparus]|uniref:cell division protein SepF n=1 Tax=Candidatus Epulonipiscium viviparus TaxID=420336 RepID=UPI00016C074E|nr:cell division protein SepF [Candidatus Epulopiscium viviparus]